MHDEVIVVASQPVTTTGEGCRRLQKCGFQSDRWRAQQADHQDEASQKGARKDAKYPHIRNESGLEPTMHRRNQPAGYAVFRWIVNQRVAMKCSIPKLRGDQTYEM